MDHAQPKMVARHRHRGCWHGIWCVEPTRLGTARRSAGFSAIDEPTGGQPGTGSFRGPGASGTAADGRNQAATGADLAAARDRRSTPGIAAAGIADSAIIGSVVADSGCASSGRASSGCASSSGASSSSAGSDNTGSDNAGSDGAGSDGARSDSAGSGVAWPGFAAGECLRTRGFRAALGANIDANLGCSRSDNGNEAGAGREH